jgi:cysteine desulfurase
MAKLRDRLENRLRAEYPEVVINGCMAERVPHCTNISFPGVNRQTLLLALDQAGVYCSTGSACASGSSEPSTVLRAMKCSETVIEGSLRLSLGATTTAEEIDRAAQIILQMAVKLGRSQASPLTASATRESTQNPL